LVLLNSPYEPKKQKLDIVVVAFLGELKLLQLQARSLRLYADADLIKNIHILVHDRHPEIFLWRFLQRVLPEYGVLAKKINFVDTRVLFGVRVPRDGWWGQQAAKLLAARVVSSDCYLVLDCKNHLIRSLNHESIFDQTGRMKMPMDGIHEPYRERYNAAREFFGLATKNEAAKTLPSITPFLFKTAFVLDLLQYIETKENCKFYDFFQRKICTEFYLYIAFLAASNRPIDASYSQCKTIRATFFKEAVHNENIQRQIQKMVQNDNVYSFGVHRKAAAIATPEFVEIVFQIWRRFSLSSNQKETEYFLSPDKALASGWLTKLKRRTLRLANIDFGGRPSKRANEFGSVFAAITAILRKRI